MIMNEKKKKKYNWQEEECMNGKGEARFRVTCQEINHMKYNKDNGNETVISNRIWRLN